MIGFYSLFIVVIMSFAATYVKHNLRLRKGRHTWLRQQQVVTFDEQGDQVVVHSKAEN